jgi:hypothetical protein
MCFSASVIKLFAFLKSIDLGFDKFYNKNLEECEKDEANDKDKDKAIDKDNKDKYLYERLFYFTKR